MISPFSTGVSMDVKQEMLMVENTLKTLRRGNYEFTGEECLVFQQLFSFWAKKLHELKNPPPVIIPTPVAEPLPQVEEAPKKKKKKDIE
jgi:hypothetical protein